MVTCVDVRQYDRSVILFERDRGTDRYRDIHGKCYAHGCPECGLRIYAALLRLMRSP